MKSLHEEIVYSTDINLINSPAFYDCCIHIICNRGKVDFLYNCRTFTLACGDIAIISRPRLITEVTPSHDISCEFIAAPEKFLHNLLPANNYSIQGRVSLFDNPIMKVSEAEALRFRHDISNIRARMADVDHRFYHEMLGGLFQTLIYDLFDFHSKLNDNILTTDRVGYITTSFFALIEAGSPATERAVSYYARALNVTPKYLADTIKRVTGASVSSHINKAAAAIIIEFLKDNKLSIMQIAEEMKFTSLSYFSRYCVKHIGMSPAKYRTAGAHSDK